MSAEVSILSGTPLAEADPDPGVFALANYGAAAFHRVALADDKGRVNFIKECVRDVRNCHEFRRYLKFISENINLQGCSYLRNMGPELANEVKIECHHHPLTLYDICELVLCRVENTGSRLTTMSITNEVVALHFRGLVGLVPLTETLHEMAHDGQLFIDPQTIHGKWDDLIREYAMHFPEHLVAKLGALATTWDRAAQGHESNGRALAVEPLRWITTVRTRAEIGEVRQEGQDDDDSGSLFDEVLGAPEEDGHEDNPAEGGGGEGGTGPSGGGTARGPSWRHRRRGGGDSTEPPAGES